MNRPMLHRRDFLAVSAAAGAAALVARGGEASPWKTRLHKAMLGIPDEATLASWRAAGFEGIESLDRGASLEKAAAARKIAQRLGMQIHGVLYGWANFNRPSAVAGDLASVTAALHTCRAYGASTLLLVPCRIGGMPMPEPWEFNLRFDANNGHLERVVAGDNGPYAAYMKAHDEAADASRAAIERLLPVAQQTGVVIAVENVWNNLWVKPDFFRNFVASFGSPWVRAYFDIGNHVKYAPPQQWIRTLGHLIAKCHVKDFRLHGNGRGGECCNIREGSVNWPAVRRALDDVGYQGWLSIEGGTLSLEENSRRLDLILAGK